MSDALSGFQRSGVNLPPAPHIQIHVRQQKHAPVVEGGVENQGTRMHL